jgi:SAM-dependent methyltransferase
MRAFLHSVRVLGLRHMLKLQHARRLSQRTIRGHYTTRAIMALFEVGLLDALRAGGAVDLDDFAAAQGLDAEVLRFLCDYLYELRLLRRVGRRYTLDHQGVLLVETLRGSFDIVGAYDGVFSNLVPLLRREKIYGREVWRTPSLVASGSGEVGGLLAFPLVYDLIRRGSYTNVLDLGCGDGTFLIDICQRDATLHGYGVDLSPEAIAIGTRRIARGPLKHRIELLVADICALEPVRDQIARLDVATCIYVLHELLYRSETTALKLLGSFRASFPGVPLIVCEVIGHSSEVLRRHPGGLLEIQLFHKLSQQQLASRETWRALFSQAGFTNIREDYFGFARTAIYTVS